VGARVLRRLRWCGSMRGVAPAAVVAVAVVVADA